MSRLNRLEVIFTLHFNLLIFIDSYGMQHLKSGTSTMGFFLLKPTELSPKRTQRVLDGDSRFGCEVPKILTLYD